MTTAGDAVGAAPPPRDALGPAVPALRRQQASHSEGCQPAPSLVTALWLPAAESLCLEGTLLLPSTTAPTPGDGGTPSPTRGLPLGSGRGAVDGQGHTEGGLCRGEDVTSNTP